MNAGAAGIGGNFEVNAEQGLLGSASDASLATGGQGGFIQENVQYAAYGQAAGQLPVDQQAAYAYQQQAYASASTVEGQSFGGKREKCEWRVERSFSSDLLAEQQQGFEQVGGFAQNVQYQTIPQYGPSA